MRDLKVEEFLAHTRLASEEDAKADFERRVERKIEEVKGDVAGHQFHGNQWGAAEGMSKPELVDHLVGPHGFMGVERNSVTKAELLRAHATSHAGGHPAEREPVKAHTHAASKSAPTGETKYSDSQPRDDHGRFGWKDMDDVSHARAHREIAKAAGPSSRDTANQKELIGAHIIVHHERNPTFVPAAGDKTLAGWHAYHDDLHKRKL